MSAHSKTSPTMLQLPPQQFPAVLIMVLLKLVRMWAQTVLSALIADNH